MQFKIKLSLMLSVLIFAGACASSQKRESNALDYLNGNNYQTPPTGIPVIVEHQSPLTVISGSLLIGENASIPEPLKYQTLVLMNGKTEVAKTMTDAGGNFTFTGYIKNDEYKVISLSQKYVVNEFLKITAYKTIGIRLFATEKK